MFPECSTWPSGRASLAWCVEGPESDPKHHIFLFASFLFFPSFFSFSFHLVFILGLTVLLCFYIQLTISQIYKFSSRLSCRSPEVLREVLRFTYFQQYHSAVPVKLQSLYGVKIPHKMASRVSYLVYYLQSVFT